MFCYIYMNSPGTTGRQMTLRDAVRILFSRVCSCELKSVLMVKLRKTTCSYFMCKIVISGNRICMSLLYQNMWFEWINRTYSNLVLYLVLRIYVPGIDPRVFLFLFFLIFFFGYNFLLFRSIIRLNLQKFQYLSYSLNCLLSYHYNMLFKHFPITFPEFYNLNKNNNKNSKIN